MNWLVGKLGAAWDRVVESLTWLSVQVTLGWGVVWTIFGSLPADVMTELLQVRVWYVSVPAWMGITQTLMTYLARLKKPKAAN